jgi:nucleotide-binding universal stress UspA family protein
MQLKTILALTDLEPQSLTGLRAGYAIAKKHGAKLIVGHVLVPRTLSQANVREFLEAHGLEPDTVTIDIEVDADVYEGIDLMIENSHPDLLVLSWRRQKGAERLLFASVPLGIVGEVTAPILALHEGQEKYNFKRALVCLDGSPQAEQLLDAAAALLDDDGEIVALNVMECSPLVIAGLHIGSFSDEVMAKAREAAQEYLTGVRNLRKDLPIRTDLREGSAVHEIANARLHHHADLVVIGSGGIGGRTKFFVGSVTSGVVQDIDVPTLVVPSSELP